jgi:hypothetical protein
MKYNPSSAADSRSADVDIASQLKRANGKIIPELINQTLRNEGLWVGGYGDPRFLHLSIS